jgi:flagellar biosynthesis protein FliR
VTPALGPFDREIVLFVLELSRLTGVVAVSPIPWTNAPQRVRVGLVLFLGLAVHGPSLTMVSSTPLPTPSILSLGTELLIGVSIGFVVRLAIASVEIAGNAIAAPMGVSAAEAFDPSIGSADTAVTRLLRQLALLLAVAVGFHRTVLEAAISSFRSVPVGYTPHFASTLELFMALGGSVFSVGLRLALPLLAVLLTANLALGFVSRAAPALQLFSVGFAALLATGAAALLYSLPDLAAEILREFSIATDSLSRMLRALAPH